MKLLFDQNLSPRLTSMLQDIYPESLHVRNVGLGDAGAVGVADMASSGGAVVVLPID
jgi:predicted nuclease of predicted toxin-antitoxin system